MQITVNACVVIHQPPTQVFSCLTDISKWPQWGGNLVSMEQISAGAIQVGSQIRQITKGGRSPSETVIEVTEYVPDSRFGIKGPTLEGTFILEPIEGSTKLNAQFEIEATGPIALMYKVMLKQFVMSDLGKFKKLVGSTEITGV